MYLFLFFKFMASSFTVILCLYLYTYIFLKVPRSVRIVFFGLTIRHQTADFPAEGHLPSPHFPPLPGPFYVGRGPVGFFLSTLVFSLSPLSSCFGSRAGETFFFFFNYRTFQYESAWKERRWGSEPSL